VTLIVFGLYVAYLFLSRTAAWRGARASTLCVVSFVVVVLSFTVVNVYLSQYHRYF
jgi:ABC-type transport system involved in cytochrome c biogenesis permease subunit